MNKTNKEFQSLKSEIVDNSSYARHQVQHRMLQQKFYILQKMYSIWIKGFSRYFKENNHLKVEI